MEQNRKKYDVFICHASEDKVGLVRPLVTSLTDQGYRVWYDEDIIQAGDGLRRSIDFGISNSRYGIVIMSKEFFNKGWTNYELDGLVQIDLENPGTIIPIWYDITIDDVSAYSRSLANKFAIQTNGNDLKNVIYLLEKKLGEYIYSIDDNGNVIRSDQKINIPAYQRETGYQGIQSLNTHKLFDTVKTICTNDCIIYPFSTSFNEFKFNFWQQNTGEINIIRHVAYDQKTGHLISTTNDVTINDGNRFISSVKFDRISDGPVRIVSEISTTNLYKSLFTEGFDDVEMYHRIKFGLFSFSFTIPLRDEFKDIKVFVNGVACELKHYPGNRVMKHTLRDTADNLTTYAFTNQKEEL